MPGGVHRCGDAEEVAHPRAAGVHDRTRLDFAAAPAIPQRGAPPAVLRAQRRAARAREHDGAAIACVDGVQHHEARIVDPGVRIDEATPVIGAQRRAGDVRAQVDARGGGEAAPPREMVVEEQPGADEPRGTQVRGVRHDEVQRPDEVRRGGEQHLALAQRLAHQAEVQLLEVAQPAVDELGARRGGVRGEIVLLAQHHRQAAPRGVAGDAGAVDAPTDDQQVAAARGAHASRGACRP